MKNASRPKGNARERLRRAIAFGKRWNSCYWRESFAHEGREVLVAEVPLVLLKRIECETLTARDAVTQMVSVTARRAGRALTPEETRAYRALWDEAVHYALGVRKDAYRAWVCGEYALVLADRGDWLDAFHVAKQAADMERDLSGRSRYWHRLLYTFADVLVALGYGERHPFLRSYAQAPHRAAAARHEGRGRRWHQ